MPSQRIVACLALACCLCLAGRDISLAEAQLSQSRALVLAQAGEVGAPKRKTEKIKAEAHLSVEKLIPGERCRILVRLTIEPGWHINTNPAKPTGFVATEVSFKGKQGTKLVDLVYPAGKNIRMQDLDEPVSVYEGKVDLFGALDVPAEAAGQTEEMEIVVRYQACDDKQCLLPATVKLSGKLPIAKAGETVRTINDKLFRPSAS